MKTSTFAPSRYDDLVYRWVKLEGKTQTWVANALQLNQSTVSRIIQRYERWQSRAKAREGGRLDPAERLRAQRWLTFQRNEVILESCMRIANELEGFTDVTQSVYHRPMSDFNKETEIRTVHSVLDRTGTTARFLRLAFRINMEQLKLSQHDPLPPLEPLTAEELAEIELLDADAAADFAAMIDRFESNSQEPASSQHTPCAEDPAGCAMPTSADPTPPASTRDASTAAVEITPNPNGTLAEQAAYWQQIEDAEYAELEKQIAAGNFPGPTNAPEPEAENHEPGTGALTAPPPPLPPSPPHLSPLHKTHNDEQPQIAATACQPCSCDQDAVPEKIQQPCITAGGPPHWPWPVDAGLPGAALTSSA